MLKEAIVIPVDEKPYLIEIESEKELETLQRLVGGWIELVPQEGPVSVFCNEEGKIEGLPINYRADHVLGIPDDVLVGTIVVLGREDEQGDTTSLGSVAEPLLQRLTEISDVDIARWKDWRDLRARRTLARSDEEHRALDAEEEELRQRGISETLAQDLKNPEQWFWLSFADPDKEPGEQFLGVAVVQGGGLQEAVQNAWTMGINPGGEVKAIPIPEEHVPDEEYRRRLLSRDELEEAGLA